MQIAGVFKTIPQMRDALDVKHTKNLHLFPAQNFYELTAVCAVLTS